METSALKFFIDFYVEVITFRWKAIVVFQYNYLIDSFIAISG